MQQYTSFKEHYRFTHEETETLLQLKPQMEELAEEFAAGFYDHILVYAKISTFLKNKEIIAQHRTKIKEWFINLFCGKYDMTYFMHLYKIGETHVKIGLPTHYVNSAFTFTRVFILEKLEDNFVEKEQHIKEIKAVEKILDMNLDVLTSSYREEELGKFLSMSKFEKSILSGLKRFTSYFNMLLAGALAIVAFFAIALFSHDVYLLFASDIGMEKGILTVLGSLLVLWAAIELMLEEIKHLQGKGFSIGAFITLAMAALIRKVLIYSLSSKKGEELLIIGALILGLAISYRLVGVKKETPAG